MSKKIAQVKPFLVQPDENILEAFLFPVHFIQVNSLTLDFPFYIIREMINILSPMDQANFRDSQASGVPSVSLKASMI